ncbi:hypothetical protein JW960_09965 [candidate division KSB1 bacterium]|nr:hypothetical protein [candidate division KSB1 bacterium]
MFSILMLAYCDTFLGNNKQDENETLKKALKRAKLNALTFEVYSFNNDTLIPDLELLQKTFWRDIEIPEFDTLQFDSKSLAEINIIFENDTMSTYDYLYSRSGLFYYFTGTAIDIKNIVAGNYSWIYYEIFENPKAQLKPCIYLSLKNIEPIE